MEADEINAGEYPLVLDTGNETWLMITMADETTVQIESTKYPIRAKIDWEELNAFLEPDPGVAPIMIQTGKDEGLFLENENESVHIYFSHKHYPIDVKISRTKLLDYLYHHEP